MRIPPPPRLAPLAVIASVVALPLLALGVQLLLRPGIYTVPYVLFFFAVALVAWLGGWRAGLVSVALSAVLGDFFFISPYGTFSTSSGALLATALFAAVAAMVCLLTSSLRTQYAELARIHEEERQAQENVRSSSEKLAVALESAQMGTWSFDSRSGEIQPDARMRELLGLPVSGEISFEALLGRIHPDDHVHLREMHARVTDPDAPRRGGMEYRTVPDAEGQARRVRTTWKAFFEGTTFVRSVGTILDVTEIRRQQENAAFLAQVSVALLGSLGSTEIFSRLVELAVPYLGDWCAVDVWNGDGDFQRLAVHHRDPAKRALGFELFTRYPPRASDPAGLPNVVRTGRPEWAAEVSPALIEAVAQDAEHLRFIRELGLHSYMTVPLKAGEQVLGAISLVFAESGRRYSERELQVAQEFAHRAAMAIVHARLTELAQTQARRAEEANRLKDEFLATVSHELRTPLTSMLGYTSMLRMGAIAPERRDYALEVIERNVRAQQRLIEDLLDVSRITAGKVHLETRPLPPVAPVEAALDAVRPAAEARRIALHAELDREAGLIQADASRIQQVVWNLLSNAIKFTPEGGTVTVRLARSGKSVEISVADTGVGIPAAFLPHVFDRFRQADSSITRYHGGLGLGLAIVKHLVELHGGSVEARSAGEGQGATFAVRLPAIAEPAEVPGQAGHVAPRAWPSAADVTSLSGIRVLLVEDEADSRELLGEVLRCHGGEVVTAESATEALGHLARQPFDVLVSDLGLPGEDGYSLIRRVRRQLTHAAAAIPAVALTAMARPEDRRMALGAGFSSYLSKPVVPGELIQCIAQALRRRGELTPGTPGRRTIEG